VKAKESRRQTMEVDRLRDDNARLGRENAELRRERDDLARAIDHALPGIREDRAKSIRCDRYEAPGPALLKAEHRSYCSIGACECEGRNVAYREQHARCVAVVGPALSAALEYLRAACCAGCGEPKHKCCCTHGPRERAILLLEGALVALRGDDCDRHPSVPVCLGCGGPRDKADSDHCSSCEGP
jgi:hypothetical protein